MYVSSSSRLVGFLTQRYQQGSQEKRTCLNAQVLFKPQPSVTFTPVPLVKRSHITKFRFQG